MYLLNILQISSGETKVMRNAIFPLFNVPFRCAFPMITTDTLCIGTGNTGLDLYGCCKEISLKGT